MREQSAEQIRRSMDEIRSHLAADAGNVADATRAMADWRTYVRRYPWICLGGAAMVGYLLVRKRADVFIPNLQQLQQLGAATKLPPVFINRNRSSMAGSLTVMLSSMLARQAIHTVEHYLSKRSRQKNRSEPTSYSKPRRSSS